MNKALSRILIFVICIVVLTMTGYLTYTVTRLRLVPAPVRALVSDRLVFARTVDTIRQGNRQEIHVTSTLKSHGVSYVRLDGDYVFFVFQGLPPDAIEVIGCPLEPERQDPSIILTDYSNRKTYRFEILDWKQKWFYWQFESWGRRVGEERDIP